MITVEQVNKLQLFAGLECTILDEGKLPTVEDTLDKNLIVLNNPSSATRINKCKYPVFIPPEFYLAVRCRSTLPLEEIQKLTKDSEQQVLRHFPDTKGLHVTHRNGWNLQVDGQMMWLTTLVSALYVI